MGLVAAATLPPVIVRVHENLCVGHGRCYALAPDVFGADDYGHCVVLVADVGATGALFDQARLGVENCPETAIEIVAGD